MSCCFIYLGSGRMILRQGQFIVIENIELLKLLSAWRSGYQLDGINQIFNIVQRKVIVTIAKYKVVPAQRESQ